MTHLIRGVQNGRFETLRDPGFRILDPCFFQDTILTAIDSKEMSRAEHSKTNMSHRVIQIHSFQRKLD